MRHVTIFFISILLVLLVACTRAASTPPTSPAPTAAQPVETNATPVNLQATADAIVAATLSAIEATQTAQQPPPTDAPLPVFATQETPNVSIFADMAITHYAYAARKWAYEQGYAPTCQVEGGDQSKRYACPEQPVLIWQQLQTGVKFYHRNGAFNPPDPTGRAFDDPGFKGHEGEPWAEEASRVNILTDYLLIAFPNPHYIGPTRIASRCDGHVFVRVLLYGLPLEFPNWDPQSERRFSDFFKADRLCNQAAEANEQEGIFDPGPSSVLEPDKALDWAYWSVLLFNADALRNQSSTPSPAASP